MSNPLTGPLGLLRGFGLILRPGLRPFVIVPLLINTLLFGGIVWYGVIKMEELSAWVTAQLPSWLSWLSWLLWPLFFIAVVLVVFYTFTLLANLIAAPFNGLLAEKVELLLTNRPLSEGGGWKEALKGALPTILAELNKLLRGLLLAIPFLLALFFVPVIGQLLWLAYLAWMLAAEYLDYPMDNHQLRYQEQRALRKGKPLVTLGFGGAVLAATMVPVLNFVVMPAAVAGATALWVEKYRS